MNKAGNENQTKKLKSLIGVRVVVPPSPPNRFQGQPDPFIKLAISEERRHSVSV